MSDGTHATIPIGYGLTIDHSVRVVIPKPYVNQPAMLQPDNTWRYTKPGRHLQVWKNGILQRENIHYTIDAQNAKIIPVDSWTNRDSVVVAFHY